MCDSNSMQPNACAIRKVKDDMTEKGGNGNGEPLPNRQRTERLPPEILEIMKPALQVGGLSGMFGADSLPSHPIASATASCGILFKHNFHVIYCNTY